MRNLENITNGKIGSWIRWASEQKARANRPDPNLRINWSFGPKILDQPMFRVNGFVPVPPTSQRSSFLLTKLDEDRPSHSGIHPRSCKHKLPMSRVMPKFKHFKRAEKKTGLC